MHFDDLIIEFYERLRCLQKIILLFGNEGSLLMFANKAGSTLGSGEATLETDDGPSWGLNCCLPLVLVVPPPYTVATSFYWWLVTSPKYSQVVLPIFEEFQVVQSGPKRSQVVPTSPALAIIASGRARPTKSQYASRSLPIFRQSVSVSTPDRIWVPELSPDRVPESLSWKLGPVMGQKVCCYWH